MPDVLDAPTRRLAEKWAGERCYLDGAPARILGRANRVATVAVLPDGPHEEYSWHVVGRIMQAGGFFDSQWS